MDTKLNSREENQKRGLYAMKRFARSKKLEETGLTPFMASMTAGVEMGPLESWEQENPVKKEKEMDAEKKETDVKEKEYSMGKVWHDKHLDHTNIIDKNTKSFGSDIGKEILNVITTGGDGAGIIPSLVNGEIWHQLVGRMSMTDAGVPILVLPNGSYKVPTESTKSTAGWYAEGAAISAGGSVFGSGDLTAHNVKCILDVSNETLLDQPEYTKKALETSLLNALSRTMNTGFLNGTGASNQPKGIYKLTGTSGGDQSATALTWDMIMDAYYNILGLGSNPQDVVAIMHPKAAAYLFKIRENDGQTSEGGFLGASAPDKLKSLKFIIDSNAPYTDSTTDTSDIVLFDAKQALRIVQFGNMQVKASGDASFSSDVTQIRATMRVDLGVRAPELIYLLSNVAI